MNKSSKAFIVASTVAATLGSAGITAAEEKAVGNTKEIVRLNPEKLKQGTPSELKDNSNMVVTDGKGGKSTDLVEYQSLDERFLVGLSQMDKVTLAIKDWPVDEFMYVIDGELEITSSTGKHYAFGPGDSFVMPKGFNGTWKQKSKIRKIAIAYETK